MVCFLEMWYNHGQMEAILATIPTRSEAQAMEIGQFETAGLSHTDIDRVLERIKQVTAEQVRAVAKQYFVDDGLTVVVLDPQPLDQAKPRPAPAGVRH